MTQQWLYDYREALMRCVDTWDSSARETATAIANHLAELREAADAARAGKDVPVPPKQASASNEPSVKRMEDSWRLNPQQPTGTITGNKAAFESGTLSIPRHTQEQTMLRDPAIIASEIICQGRTRYPVGITFSANEVYEMLISAVKEARK